MIKKNELNYINFEEDIKSIKYNIKKKINNINTIEIISGLSVNLEQYSKNVIFTGFKKSKSHLEDYSNEPFNIT